MKKVLIFIPQFPTITETFIEREVSKLVERSKLTVVVLALKRGTGTLSKESRSVVVYQKLDIFRVFLGLRYVVTTPQNVLSAFKLLQEDDSLFFVQQLYVFIKSLGYAAIFAKYKPDLIYAHFLSQPSTIALAVAEILGTPLAISAHAKDIWENAELVPIKVKKANFIAICNKSAWERTIELSGISTPKNVHLLYHGVDSQKLVVKKSVHMEAADAPVVLCIGRLVPKKGLRYLIEASNILNKKGIAHRIYIIGAGPLYNDLMTHVHKLSVEDFITFLGALPFEDALGYFGIADVFALPSINISSGDRDGVPNALIEASLLQIPCVTTNAGSITDFIEDRKTGIIVPQRNSADLANALEELFLDETLRQDLGKAACQKAEEMFNLDTNVAKIEKLLLDA